MPLNREHKLAPANNPSNDSKSIIQQNAVQLAQGEKSGQNDHESEGEKSPQSNIIQSQNANFIQPNAVIQAKLNVGEQDSKEEVEADRTADKVVNNKQSSAGETAEETIQEKPIEGTLGSLIQRETEGSGDDDDSWSWGDIPLIGGVIEAGQDFIDTMNLDINDLRRSPFEAIISIKRTISNPVIREMLLPRLRGFISEEVLTLLDLDDETLRQIESFMDNPMAKIPEILDHLEPYVQQIPAIAEAKARELFAQLGIVSEPLIRVLSEIMNQLGQMGANWRDLVGAILTDTFLLYDWTAQSQEFADLSAKHTAGTIDSFDYYLGATKVVLGGFDRILGAIDLVLVVLSFFGGTAAGAAAGGTAGGAAGGVVGGVAGAGVGAAPGAAGGGAAGGAAGGTAGGAAGGSVGAAIHTFLGGFSMGMTIGLETATILKSTSDLMEAEPVTESSTVEQIAQEEEDYRAIASSIIALGTMLAMAILGPIASRIGKTLARRLKSLAPLLGLGIPSVNSNRIAPDVPNSAIPEIDAPPSSATRSSTEAPTHPPSPSNTPNTDPVDAAPVPAARQNTEPEVDAPAHDPTRSNARDADPADVDSTSNSPEASEPTTRSNESDPNAGTPRNNEGDVRRTPDGAEVKATHNGEGFLTTTKDGEHSLKSNGESPEMCSRCNDLEDVYHQEMDAQDPGNPGNTYRDTLDALEAAKDAGDIDILEYGSQVREIQSRLHGTNPHAESAALPTSHPDGTPLSPQELESQFWQDFHRRNDVYSTHEEMAGAYISAKHGDANVASQVHIDVTVDGQTVRVIPDNLVRLENGSYVIYDAKYSGTGQIDASNAQRGYTTNQRVAYPLISGSDGPVQVTVRGTGGEALGLEAGSVINLEPEIRIVPNMHQTTTGNPVAGNLAETVVVSGG